MRKDPKKVTDQEARRTAFMVAAVLFLTSALFWYRGRIIATSVTVIFAGLLFLAGMFLPCAARIFHRGWMTFAFALGYVNSRVILTGIYFLVFVPYGIISRLSGRDPLDLRGENRESYWHRRENPRQEHEQFERLF